MKEIFDFSKSTIESYISYDLNLFTKFKSSLNYIISKLPNQRLGKSLGELQWEKGKDYNWAVIKDENLTLLIRQYNRHFTIFLKNRVKVTDDSELDDLFYTKYGCFTFFTNSDKVENYDLYENNNFFDIDLKINELIEFLKADKLHSIWNTWSFPRPNHIEIKNIWNGGDNISSIDKLVFCCEELFSKNLELFAKNEMLEKIKTFKEGDLIGSYVITKVLTEVENDYYHGVGLTLKIRDEERFQDVFSLCMFYYDIVFVK